LFPHQGKRQPQVQIQGAHRRRHVLRQSGSAITPPPIR
jgi:hypothetical protein